jgi:CCR4-NOT transcription complex subunit 6
VEANQFEQYFKPQLRMRGSYDGIFYPKSRAKTMNDWDRTFVDGCAIFFKSDRFKLEERHLIEFNQLALARPSLRKHKDVYNRVMTRDNIAIVARLTHVESKQSIIVSTVHIHWDPSHKDVKLVQSIMLVEELERLLRKNSQSALVLCGDFNALIESGVGEFLENGVLAAGHEDFGSYTYEPYSTEGAVHSLSLKNAYSLLSDEPLTFTNFTPIFCGTIDYVWFRPNNLSVTGLLGSVSGEYVKQFAGFPTQHMPSDHVPLLVEFKIEPLVASTSAAPGMQIPMHQPVLGSSPSGLGLMPYGGSGVSAASAAAFNLPHVPSTGSSSAAAAAMTGSNSTANSRRLYSRNKSTMS